ncbi:P68 family surface lipoprotein [Mycoplasmopsis lipofaciens]|uniref:P68 family surface lipoprotein n=1 Tax=Mycoplasmopsis lipofaciens TaxID=114884 RepID=UPI00048519FF|nr:P80 family lipoprotein [Mycoplasmopsis lipofaciens]
MKKTKKIVLSLGTTGIFAPLMALAAISCKKTESPQDKVAAETKKVIATIADKSTKAADVLSDDEVKAAISGYDTEKYDFVFKSKEVDLANGIISVRYELTSKEDPTIKYETTLRIDGFKKTKPYNRYANDKYASNKFDQNADGKIKIGVSFSNKKSQWNALEKIIDTYNKVMKDVEGYIPVALVSAGSGYDGAAQDVEQKIEAKNATELYNLTFNYPGLASTLAKQGMLLNLYDRNEAISTDLSIFNRSFAQSNFTTARIVNEGSWMLPAAKSTTVLGGNGPVLSYILQTMEENGATISLSNYQQIKDSAASDMETVKSIWGDPVDATKMAALNLSGYVVNDDTLKVGQNLLEFITKAQKLFVNSEKENSQLHILGIDDAAGFVQTLAFASIDADTSEMFVKSDLTNNDREINYKPIMEEQSLVGKKMSDIYLAIKRAVKSNALVLNEPGQYTSVDQKHHKYAMGLGSTAGYFHNFEKDDATNSSYFYNGESLGDDFYPVFKNDNKFAFKDGRHTNYFDLSTVSEDPNFGYKSTNTETDTKLNEVFAKPEMPTSSNNEFVAFMVSGSLNDKMNEISTTYPNDFVKVGTFNKFYKGEKAANEFTMYVRFGNANGNLILKTFDKTTLLNENELFTFSSPTKWAETDRYNVIYTQGPSLIGIHANDEEDKATKMFVKFLVSNQAQADLENKTPWEYFGEKASYIFPINGFENVDNSGLENRYLAQAASDFSNIIKNPDEYVSYEEYGGPDADEFRKQFRSVYTQIYTKHKNGQEAGTYKEQVIDGLTTALANLFK